MDDVCEIHGPGHSSDPLMCDGCLGAPVQVPPERKTVAHAHEILLIDCGNVFWPSYYRDGDADAAVRRTIGRVHSFVRDFPNIAICIDAERCWRHDLMAEWVTRVHGDKTDEEKTLLQYKGKRERKPESAKVALAGTIERLRGEGFPVWGFDNMEADDVIGSAVSRIVELGWRAVVLSSDQDLLVLVQDGVRVMSTADLRIYDAAQVKTKFGVEPSKLADWAALVGDASDGVPGCPGIGEQRATGLITRFGSLRAVLDAANADQLKLDWELRSSHGETGLGECPTLPDPPLTKSMKANLVKYAEQIEMSRRLVGLRSDLPVAVEQAVMKEPPKPGLREMAERAGDPPTTLLASSGPFEEPSHAEDPADAADYEAMAVEGLADIEDAPKVSPFVHGYVLDLPDPQYHLDPCDVPSLSASIATIIDAKSPAHAFTAHPKLGKKSRPPTKALDLGTLAHRLLLGTGREVVSITADDFRTKAAREMRDEARADGKVPVLQAAYEAAFDAKGVISKKLDELGLSLDGQSEVSLFWKSENGVQCRARVDHLKLGNGATIIDLKSCDSAHPDACQRAIDNFGYAIQRAAYIEAGETLWPEYAGRFDYIIAFFELEEPYAVTPVRLSAEFAALGQRRWDRALRIWKRCTETGKWPAYAKDIIEIEPPNWAITKEIARSDQETR